MDRCCDTFLQHRASDSHKWCLFSLRVWQPRRRGERAWVTSRDLRWSAGVAQNKSCAAQAMVRFVRAKASRAAPASSAKPREVVELGALVDSASVPVGPITTIGRVTYVFGHAAGALAILGHVCELLQREERDSEWLWLALNSELPRS